MSKKKADPILEVLGNVIAYGFLVFVVGIVVWGINWAWGNAI